MHILHALDDEKVFAPFFRGDSWSAWRVFLSVLYALPLSPAQVETYQQHTGRSAPPAKPAKHLVELPSRTLPAALLSAV